MIALLSALHPIRRLVLFAWLVFALAAAGGVSQAHHNDPPSGFKVASIGSDFIQVSWDDLEGEDRANFSGYEVRYVGQNGWTNASTFTFWRFRSLSANTEYELQLRTRYLNTDHRSSAASLMATTKPNPPTNPIVSNITPNSMKLTWTEGEGGAASYEVSSTDGRTWVDSDSNTEHVFTSLRHNSAYTLQVRARNASGVTDAVSASGRTSPPPTATPVPPSATPVPPPSATPVPPPSATPVPPTPVPPTDTPMPTLTPSNTPTVTPTPIPTVMKFYMSEFVSVAKFHWYGDLSASYAGHTLELCFRRVSPLGEYECLSSTKTIPNRNPAFSDPVRRFTHERTAEQTQLVWEYALRIKDKDSGLYLAEETVIASAPERERDDSGTLTFADANDSGKRRVSWQNSDLDHSKYNYWLHFFEGREVLAKTRPCDRNLVTRPPEKIAMGTTSKTFDYPDDFSLLSDTGNKGACFILMERDKTTGRLRKEIRLRGVYPKPSGLYATDITQSAITLNWRKAWHAISYEVNYGLRSAIVPINVGDVTSYRFTSLPSNTYFILKVRAIHADVSVDALDYVSLPVFTLPDPPTNPVTSNITHDSITLSWTAPLSGSDIYEVSSGGTWVESDSDKDYSDTSYVFTGLMPSTAYTLWVRSKNKGGVSSGVSAASVRTLPSPMTPTPIPTAMPTPPASIPQVNLNIRLYRYSDFLRLRPTINRPMSIHWFGDLSAYSGGTYEICYRLLSPLGNYTCEDRRDGVVIPASNPSITHASRYWHWDRRALTYSQIYQISLRIKDGDTGVYLAEDDNLIVGPIKTEHFQATLHYPGGDETKRLVAFDQSKLDHAKYDYWLNFISVAGDGGVIGGCSGVHGVGMRAPEKITAGVGSKIYNWPGDFERLGSSGAVCFLIQKRDKSTGRVLTQQSAGGSEPTGLTTSGITQTAITLNWIKDASATSYEVMGGTVTSWTDIGDVALYEFSGLSANTQYTLRVRVHMPNVTPGFIGGVASVGVFTLPNAPTSPSTSEITMSSIKLSWTASVGGADSYEVSSDGSTWVDSDSDTEHVFTSLTPGTTYTLSVRAKNVSGVSGPVSASASTTGPTPIPDLTATHEANQTATKVAADLTATHEANQTATKVAADLTATQQAQPTATATPVPPAAPTGLSTSGITQMAITLDWTKSAGATSYEVNGGALNAWTDAGDVATYQFTGLTANTQYTLQVRAVNDGGQSAAASESATTLPNAPAAPTGLSTSGITQTAITLDWTKSAGATGYKVQVDNGTVTTLGDVATHEFTGLTADTSYTLKVVAFNSGGDSSAASADASTLPNAPAAPTGLSTSGITQTAITLDWTKSAGATGYKVQVDNGAVTTLGDVATYEFTGLTADTSYTLKVVAFNSGGDSSAASVSASTLPNAPAAPTGLSTSGITQTAITLDWTKSAGATGYKVQVDNGTVTTLGDVATHEFTGLTADTSYTLKVVAFNSGGDSSAASADASTLPNAPAAPTGLSTSGITQTTITLSWTKSTGATGYKVQVDNGAVTTLGDVATYEFTGLTADTSYTLKVVAFNSGGDSSAASVSESTLPNAPAAPTGLSTSGITQTAITLSWTKSTGATGYKVQLDNGTVTTLGDVATHTFTGLTADTSYTLKVVAFNSGGDSSAASADASTLPNAPAAPTGLSTSGITQTAITLSWTKSTGATGYKVQVDSDAVVTLGDVATYEFTGLTADTSYTLKVVAFNSGGDSSAASVSESTAPVPTATPMSVPTDTPVPIPPSNTPLPVPTDTPVPIPPSNTPLPVPTATPTPAPVPTAIPYVDMGFHVNSFPDNTSDDVGRATFQWYGNLSTAYAGDTLEICYRRVSPLGAYRCLATKTVPQSNPALSHSSRIFSFPVGAGVTAHLWEFALRIKDKDSGLYLGQDSMRVSGYGGGGAIVKTHFGEDGVGQRAVSWQSSDLDHTQYNYWLVFGSSQALLGCTVDASAGLVGIRAPEMIAMGTTSKTFNYPDDFSPYNSNEKGICFVLQEIDKTTGRWQGQYLGQGVFPMPSNPTVTGITQTAMTLNWTKISFADSYEVQRSNNGSYTAWSDVGDVASYEFTGLTANTEYTLRVRVKVAGETGDTVSTSGTTLPIAPTNTPLPGPPTATPVPPTDTPVPPTDTPVPPTDTPVPPTDTPVPPTATPGPPTATPVPPTDTPVPPLTPTNTAIPPPGAPTGLSTSGITQTAITLNWTKVASATSYEVMGGTVNSWTDVGDVALYEFTGLSANSQYTLQVRAISGGGPSGASSATGKTFPNAPTSPSTSEITVSSIKLTWTASVGGADSYEVSSDGSTWVDSGSDTEHVFSGLDHSTAYTLRVRAKNASGVSAAVSAASASTLVPTPVPPTPTPIPPTATPVPPTPTPIPPTATPVPPTPTPIPPTNTPLPVPTDTPVPPTDTPVPPTDTPVPPTDTPVPPTDTPVPPTDTPVPTLTPTNTPTGTPTNTAIPPPGAPTGLSTSGITQTAITLNWIKVASATSYEVMGGTVNSWTDVGDVALYEFTGLSANSQYTLQVRAISGGGPSGASSATGKTLPNAPTSPSTSEITVSSIKLTWTASVGGADSYEVSSDGSTWVDSGSDTEHVFSGLLHSTAYTLQVRARNVSGVSAAVSAASASTLVPTLTPVPPTPIPPTNTPLPVPTATATPVPPTNTRCQYRLPQRRRYHQPIHRCQYRLPHRRRYHQPIRHCQYRLPRRRRYHQAIRHCQYRLPRRRRYHQAIRHCQYRLPRRRRYHQAIHHCQYRLPHRRRYHQAIHQCQYRPPQRRRCPQAIRHCQYRLPRQRIP